MKSYSPSLVNLTDKNFEEVYENEEEITISIKDVEQAIKGTKNWKAPGPDNIQGFWIKYLVAVKECLLETFQEWLKYPSLIPDEMLKGKTTLLFKGGESTQPKNYRPITCLNIVLKVFTTIIKNKIERKLAMNPMEKQISLNQLGCKKMSYAAKEGLLVSTLTQSCLNKNGKRWVEMYYDVKKAYDSVNHEWLIQCLKYYEIPANIIRTIERMMNL